MKTLRILVAVVLSAWLLPAADAQTTSNTLVRFRFTFGQTLVGDAIFELYDQQKPVTVSNFLNYVRSGAYWNTILHRSDPRIIQGGFVGVCNPYLNVELDNGFVVQTNAAIVNETLVGPLLSNTAGTLGMATVNYTNTPADDPDTATSSWFVNLTDNSADFNTNNGGYCVFGRVISGANVLGLFNTVFTNRVFATFLGDDELFYNLFSLPVSYYGLFYPYYSEVFVVDIMELPAQTDAVRPTVSVATPKANTTSTNETITFAGTAADAGGIMGVDVYFNYDCPIRATGTTSWTVTITNPPPGTNWIFAQSVDIAGNRSSVAFRSYFQREAAPIALHTVGGGRILGATNGQRLDINRRYILSAVPDTGWLFAVWTNSTGDFRSPGNAIALYMQTNIDLTAVFVPNQFPKVKGVYNGLFFETNNVRPNSSGFITITVGDTPGYSGKVYMEGRSHSFANVFTVDGEGFIFIDRRPYNPDFLYLTFKVDFNNPGNPILGSLLGTGTNEWLAGVMAHRKATNSAALAAKHTLLLPGGMDPAASPTGDGIGTVAVDALGGVKLAGTLADGTKLVQKSTMSQDGWWPLYLPLYVGQGSLIGWVQFDRTQGTTDLMGDLTWSKRSVPTSRYYQAGFTNPVPLIGARYVAPVGSTGSALGFSSGTAIFSDGNLAATFANVINVGPGDRITNGSPNSMKLTLVKPTGLLKGTVTPPGTTRAIRFSGAWLQKTNIGGGFFLDTNRVGRVSITPDTL